MPPVTRPGGSSAIGFDLDMTLIDSRPGIAATYDRLAAETGVRIDSSLAASRLGPPVEQEIAHWFPAEQVEAMADRYRALYPDIALPLISVLPGAHEALAAAAELGRVLLITAKNARNAHLHVERLGLAVDEVCGDAWRDQKAVVLRERSAVAYIGDHVHDMDAARGAEVLGIGVTTGPCTTAELRAAGADHVVGSLGEVTEALAGWVAG